MTEGLALKYPRIGRDLLSASRIIEHRGPMRCRKHSRAGILVCSSCSQICCTECTPTRVRCCSPNGGTYHPWASEEWNDVQGGLPVGMLARVDLQSRRAMLRWHIETGAGNPPDPAVLDEIQEEVRLAAAAGSTGACLQYAKILLVREGVVSDVVIEHLCTAAECQIYALSIIAQWLSDLCAEAKIPSALVQDTFAWGAVLE